MPTTTHDRLSQALDAVQRLHEAIYNPSTLNRAEPILAELERALGGLQRSRPSIAIRFEFDGAHGTPLAIVDGVMPTDEWRGVYMQEPIGTMPGGYEPEIDWRRQGASGPPPRWLVTALDAAWAEWWDRADQVAAAEQAAGWDPRP